MSRGTPCLRVGCPAQSQCIHAASAYAGLRNGVTQGQAPCADCPRCFPYQPDLGTDVRLNMLHAAMQGSTIASVECPAQSQCIHAASAYAGLWNGIDTGTGALRRLSSLFSMGNLT